MSGTEATEPKVEETKAPETTEVCGEKITPSFTDDTAIYPPPLWNFGQLVGISTGTISANGGDIMIADHREARR